MRRHPFITLAVLFCAVGLRFNPVDAAILDTENGEITYQVMDLGASSYYANCTKPTPAISRVGSAVVGTISTPPAVVHGYLFENGTRTVEFSAPTTVRPGVALQPCAINDDGLIVGGTATDTIAKPFLFTPPSPNGIGSGTMRVLPDPASSPSVNARIAYGINNRGDIVGSWERQAFLFSYDQYSFLAPLFDAAGNKGATEAYDVNGPGNAAGHASFPQYDAPILWRGGDTIDLGTLPLPSTFPRSGTAWAINLFDTVVGESNVVLQSGAQTRHAFMWTAGTMTDLGALNRSTQTSRALGVNDAGWIVGNSQCDRSNTSTCAVLWNSRCDRIVDLNDLLPPNSGWFLAQATGISNSMRIVGNGVFNGVPRDFELDPILTIPDDTKDDDHDGLPDDWELNGIPVFAHGAASGTCVINRNTEILDRNFYFNEPDSDTTVADPNRKDVFLWVDQECADVQPNPDALRQVQAAFKNGGIRLHIHLNQSNKSPCPQPLIDYGTTDGTMADAGWTAPNSFATNVQNGTMLENGAKAERQHVYRLAYFVGSPPPIWNYCEHRDSRFWGLTPKAQPTWVFVFKGRILKDLQEMLPALPKANATPEATMARAEAATLMHELGHSLGLDHGGAPTSDLETAINNKPNHFSVMNYLYNLGPIKLGRDGAYISPLNYSKWDSSVVRDLDENSIDESIPLTGPASLPFGVLWYSFDGAQTNGPLYAVPNGPGWSNRPIDWNIDGSINTARSVDLNYSVGTAVQSGPTVSCPKVATQTFHSRNEWEQLQFKRGEIGSPLAAPLGRASITTAAPELDGTHVARVLSKVQFQRGDIDADGDVDTDDLAFILRERGRPVAGSLCGPACDLDNDGQITALDARILTQRCSRPRCATQ